MTKWCKANNISISTIAGWLRGEKINYTKIKNKARAAEGAFPAELCAKNTADIKIEYKSFKITVPAEVEDLKPKIKEKDEKIQSLEKLNNWYIEQLN